MYNIKVQSGFSSAHRLRGYKGKCEELHGHNWLVEIVVSSAELDSTGMVLDFKLLKTRLNKVLDKLDHKYLNNLPYFRKINPTSENIARFIYDNLRPGIKNLKTTTVWENSSSCATYNE